MFALHVSSALAIRVVPTFGRRSDEAFSASWLLMLDLPCSIGRLVLAGAWKLRVADGAPSVFCTTRSFATVGSTSVMGTAIESQLRVVVPRPDTRILKPVLG